MLSTLEKREFFLDYISNLKLKYKIRITDTHVHPLDVMGVIHTTEYGNQKKEKKDHFKPSLSEKFKFGKTVNYLSKAIFQLYPRMVVSEIRASYNNIAEKRFLEEMDSVLIDNVVFLSVEPWTDTYEIAKYYNNKRFKILGSFDIQSDTCEDIEKKFDDYVKILNITGIKLHPNLQNFLPQPSHNEKGIEEKLKLIYKLTEKNKKYILFHGGYSNYTSYQHEAYGQRQRSKTNALLKNFFSRDGKSEIFDKYKMPIVIAHLGHFGLNNIDFKLSEFAVKKHKNLFFDTAAVSPKLISAFIDRIGSERILLGSDAIYNKMIYAMYFVYMAALNVAHKESVDEIIINIFGRNYNNLFK